ncbi:MAG: hypothetical protein FWE17_00555, partial [Alphaproteobacteria bacterium]|nr:hypothetical protein [Alphaproteobacteria bacterium]
MGIHWAAYNVVWEALVYDELQARRYRSIYAKVCGHKTAIECVALILACTGSLMIPLGYDFVAHVTIASVALSALFLARMKIRSRLQVKRKANAVKSLRLAGTVMKRVPYVFYLLVLVTLVYAVSQIDEYLGLIGVEVGVRPELVGGLFVISLLCQTFGNSVADRFEWLPDKKLFAGVVVIGLMLILLSIFYSVPGLVFLGLFCFVYAIVRVLVYSRFQHALPPASRSAFLSAYSFCEQATCILSYMVMMA